MPFIESFDEFKERQSCDCVLIRDSWVFANGAVARSDVRGQFDFFEPPTDPVVLLQTKINFMRAKLEQLKGDYTRQKTSIEMQADWHVKNWGPAPPNGALDHLRKSVAAIETMQGELTELESQQPQSKQEANKSVFDSERRYAANALFESLQKLPNY